MTGKDPSATPPPDEAKARNSAMSVLGTAPKRCLLDTDVGDSAWVTFDCSAWAGQWVVIKGESDFWGLFQESTGTSDPDETTDVVATSSAADNVPSPYPGSYQESHRVVPKEFPVLFVKIISGTGQNVSVERA